MCTFHTWVAINTTLSYDFMPASSYHSTSGGNHVHSYNSLLNQWKIYLYNAESIALANIDMHAHDSSLITNYQHHVIKTVHHVILKISQQIRTMLRTCWHAVIFSYTSMHGG